MKTLLLVAAVLAAAHVIHAAHKRSVTKRLAKDGVSVSTLAAAMNLGERYGFREEEKTKTPKGHERQRLRQTYAGLEVVGATTDAEVMGQGLVTGTVSGSLAYSLEDDIPDIDACRRNTTELMQVAQQYLQDKHQLIMTNATTPQHIQVHRKIHFEKEVGVAKLVYQLEFLVELVPTPCRPFFMIDACNLTVLMHFDKIHNMTLTIRSHSQSPAQCNTVVAGPNTVVCPSLAPAQGVGGNQKTCPRMYGQNQPFCLFSKVSNGTCTMVSKYAQVFDLENTRSHRGRSPVQFDCAEGYNDPVNGAFGVASDAFYYSHLTGQLYEQWYGVYALGYAPRIRIHYHTCYEQAFWNGVDVSLGDGCNQLYPLVSQDVIAHEMAHGIIDRYSNLFYTGQSGAINEAFCDLSGEVAELFSTDTNDWEVGRELFKGDSALRYYETPSNDGHSIGFADMYFDGLDVHYSSGVFRRTFWQMVNVQGIPLRQTYEIFLQANRVIWRETTNFQDGACGAMKAAYDLGYDVNKVKNAFAVVAIDLSSCNYQDFQQYISAGETRSKVKASVIRNPVFALDVLAGNTVVVDVLSEDNMQVTVSVTSDAAGANSIVSGTAPFVFNITAETGYFKVSSASDDDIVFDVRLQLVT